MVLPDITDLADWMLKTKLLAFFFFFFFFFSFLQGLTKTRRCCLFLFKSFVQGKLLFSIARSGYIIRVQTLDTYGVNRFGLVLRR